MVSIIIPCYNEQDSIPIFYKEISSVLRQEEIEYKLVFVNDGSKDGTLKLLKALAAQDEHITYLSFSRNFGKEAALYAGLCNAKGDYVAVMDADMQDPPSMLPEMLRLLEGGEYDCVAACRSTREGEPPVRSWFSRMFYKVINQISEVDIKDGARDFRLMKRDMVDAIVAMSEYNRFSKGIFGWVGFQTHWMPYQNIERVAGSTTWSFWKLFKYAIDGIVNFSQAPLNAASYGGVFITLAAFVVMLLIIVRKLIFGDPVTGWASTICIILFIGGIQLFCIGIMGQYIAKIYMETKHRPHYIISESNDEDTIIIK